MFLLGILIPACDLSSPAFCMMYSALGHPCGSVVKNLANARDSELIHGLERSPREGNGNPLQYSCVENPMDREAWWAAVPGDEKELDTT